MRIRTIKPAFWTSLTVTSLPVMTRLQFIGLWNYADDEGRGVDEARLIRSALWPMEDKVGPGQIEKMQDQLADAGLIDRYIVAGRPYFQVVGWTEHQSINKAQESLLPPGDSPEAVRRPHGVRTERALLEGKGREEGREEGREGIAPTSVDAGELPDRSGGGRREDPIFEVLFELDTGLTYSAANRATLTSDAAGVLNRAASQIRATGISPDGLRAAIGAWPSLFDEATCTAAAVKKHLPRLVAASNGAIARRSENQRDKLERELRAAR